MTPTPAHGRVDIVTHFFLSPFFAARFTAEETGVRCTVELSCMGSVAKTGRVCVCKVECFLLCVFAPFVRLNVGYNLETFIMYKARLIITIIGSESINNR